LDRLLSLLDTGSTEAVRQSAVEQIGEVQRLHPHELNNLLKKVIWNLLVFGFLRHCISAVRCAYCGRCPSLYTCWKIYVAQIIFL